MTRSDRSCEGTGVGHPSLVPSGTTYTGPRRARGGALDLETPGTLRSRGSSGHTKIDFPRRTSGSVDVQGQTSPEQVTLGRSPPRKTSRPQVTRSRVCAAPLHPRHGATEGVGTDTWD